MSYLPRLPMVLLSACVFISAFGLCGCGGSGEKPAADSSGGVQPADSPGAARPADSSGEVRPADFSEPELAVLSMLDRLGGGDITELSAFLDPTSDYAIQTEKEARELAQTGETSEPGNEERALMLKAFPLVYKALQYAPKLGKVEVDDRSATVEVIFAVDLDGEKTASMFQLNKRMDEKTRQFGWYVAGIDSGESLQATIQSFLQAANDDVDDALAEQPDFRDALFDLMGNAGGEDMKERVTEAREDLKQREARINDIAAALRAYGEAEPGEGGPANLVQGLCPKYVDAPEKLAMPGKRGVGDRYVYNPPQKDVGSPGADPKRLVLLDADGGTRQIGRFGLFEDGSIHLLSERQLAALASAGGTPEASARERAMSQNNLKQWGLIMKMYANESKGMRFPPVASAPGNLMLDGATLYPEYCTDPTILVNPGRPDAAALLDQFKEMPTDPAQAAKMFNDTSYVYLGYAIGNEAEGLTLCAAWRQAAAEGQRLTDDLKVAPGSGSVGGDTIFRLREGIERFFITDINNPAASAMAQATIPIMWERPLNAPGGTPLPISVLYLDGHVSTVEPGTFPNTEAFQKALAELDALGEGGK